MRLEEYLEFEKIDTQFGPVERIRIKGHRIALEHVVEPFNAGVPPDTIVRDYYPTLSREEVYAAIAYYLHNQAKMDEYIREGEEIGGKYYQEYFQKEPPPALERLRALKSEKRGEKINGDG